MASTEYAQNKNAPSTKERVEKAYGMSFKDVIEKVHLKEGVSIYAIGKRSKCHPTGVSYNARQMGFELRGWRDAMRFMDRSHPGEYKQCATIKHAK